MLEIACTGEKIKHCNGKQGFVLLNPITSTWVDLYTTVKTDNHNFSSSDLARTSFRKLNISTEHLMDNGTATQY